MKAFCSFGLVCVSAFLVCGWIVAPPLAAATLEKEGLTTPDLSAICAKASVYGPQRNDPADRCPRRTYSPFDNINSNNKTEK